MKQVLILAGGKGTRLGKLTETMPKPLLKFDGTHSTLSILINKCLEENFEEIIILAGYLPKAMQEFYDNLSLAHKKKIRILFEKDLLGTYGAINNAFHHLATKFLVLNGDTLLNFNFDVFYDSADMQKLDACIAIKKANDCSDRFGAITLKGNLIDTFCEKSTSNNCHDSYLSLGCYVLTKKLFHHHNIGIKSSLEFDLLPELARNKRMGFAIYENNFIDIGTPDSYLIAPEFDHDS